MFMFCFSPLLRHLQAAIAVVAARDRTLTVLLVALCGRIARMGTRLDRLVALWRAGKLPKPRAPRVEGVRVRAAQMTPRVRFPTAPGWLRRKLGFEVGSHGSQLLHLLTEAECQAFLAAVPQAGRILRPLLGMLIFDPLPVVVRKVIRGVAMAVNLADPVGVAMAPTSQFLDA